MTAIDTIFIFMYLLGGYAGFVFVGSQFGRNYAILGFFLGYLVAWQIKRVVVKFVPSKKSPKANGNADHGHRHNDDRSK